MAGVLREGPVGSAWFAHFDRAGAVAHVDVRGPTYKGSLTGGVKSLFRLPLKGQPLPRLVLTEAAIDALSLAAIEIFAETRSTQRPAAAWVRARSPRSRRCWSILQSFLTRSSAAPPTLMDRGIALPTGTDHSPENSASGSRGFGLPSKAATGTRSFALNRKRWVGSGRTLSFGNDLADQLAVAAEWTTTTSSSRGAAELRRS